MGLQSARVTELDEYLGEESAARERNLSAFDLELEMAALIFRAAQQAIAAYPILVDAPQHRAKIALALSSVRYFATAVDLCVRGNGAEAAGVMRSAIEFAAYATKLKREPGLIDAWASLLELTGAERQKLFGRDKEILALPETARAAEMYDAFSVFGVHARTVLTEQAVDFNYRGGWKLRHGEVDSHHVRWALLGVVLTMRDLVADALAPLYLDDPWPEDLTRSLDEFEKKRLALHEHRKSFLSWMKDPKRSVVHEGRVTPVRGRWPA